MVFNLHSCVDAYGWLGREIEFLPSTIFFLRQCLQMKIILKSACHGSQYHSCYSVLFVSDFSVKKDHRFKTGRTGLLLHYEITNSSFQSNIYDFNTNLSREELGHISVIYESFSVHVVYTLRPRCMIVPSSNTAEDCCDAPVFLRYVCSSFSWLSLYLLPAGMLYL